MEEYLKSLQKLEAILPVRKILRDAGIDKTGVSWNDVKTALRAIESPAITARLKELLTELRLHGRKHVYLYEIPDPVRDAMFRVQPPPDPSPLTDVFPLIPEVAPPIDEPVLARVFDVGNVRHFVFCGQRLVRNESQIDPKYLLADAPDEYRSAFCVQITREQGFDVVTVRQDGILEVRVDLFHHPTKPAPSDIAEALRNRMLSMLDGQVTGMFSSPFDFRPALRSIYNDATEGRISELAFACTTDARRREVMQDKNKDLRTEAYHKAGAAAVGAVGIDVYRLGVDWAARDDEDAIGRAHLLLPGGLRQLQKDHANLYEAQVPRVTRKREYDFVMERLIHHVRAERAADQAG